MRPMIAGRLRPSVALLAGRPGRAARGVAAGLLLGLILAASGAHPVDIIQNAVCKANSGQIDCNSAGLGGITVAANDLVSPVLVALFAVCPIACLIGAGAVMFGNRRGLIIIGSALGALVLAGAVKGIVA